MINYFYYELKMFDMVVMFGILILFYLVINLRNIVLEVEVAFSIIFINYHFYRLFWYVLLHNFIENKYFSFHLVGNYNRFIFYIQKNIHHHYYYYHHRIGHLFSYYRRIFICIVHRLFS